MPNGSIRGGASDWRFALPPFRLDDAHLCVVDPLDPRRFGTTKDREILNTDLSQ